VKLETSVWANFAFNGVALWYLLRAPSLTVLTTTRLVSWFALGNLVLLGELDKIDAGGWCDVMGRISKRAFLFRYTKVGAVPKRLSINIILRHLGHHATYAALNPPLNQRRNLEFATTRNECSQAVLHFLSRPKSCLALSSPASAIFGDPCRADRGEPNQ
jgi:hypothetical protein